VFGIEDAKWRGRPRRPTAPGATIADLVAFARDAVEYQGAQGAPHPELPKNAFGESEAAAQREAAARRRP
jgi:hypothetical protein